jgi:hypothetical protein
MRFVPARHPDSGIKTPSRLAEVHLFSQFNCHTGAFRDSLVPLGLRADEEDILVAAEAMTDIHDRGQLQVGPAP